MEDFIFEIATHDFKPPGYTGADHQYQVAHRAVLQQIQSDIEKFGNPELNNALDTFKTNSQNAILNAQDSAGQLGIMLRGEN